MASGRTAGLVTVKIGGIDYGTKDDWDFDMGGMERTSEFSSTGRGTFETPAAGKASGSVMFQSNSDLEALRNFDGGDVTFIFTTGHEYVSANCSMMKPPKPMGGGKGVKLEIEGDKWVKVAGP